MAVVSGAFATHNASRTAQRGRLREVRMLGRIISSLFVAVAVFGALSLTAPAAAAQSRIPPTVTLYIPSGIGGGYDSYGRLASRHLGRFLPGDPTLVPKNM